MNRCSREGLSCSTALSSHPRQYSDSLVLRLKNMNINNPYLLMRELSWRIKIVSIHSGKHFYHTSYHTYVNSTHTERRGLCSRCSWFLYRLSSHSFVWLHCFFILMLCHLIFWTSKQLSDWNIFSFQLFFPVMCVTNGHKCTLGPDRWLQVVEITDLGQKN